MIRDKIFGGLFHSSAGEISIIVTSNVKFDNHDFLILNQ